jgi:hypothetical protein
MRVVLALLFLLIPSLGFCQLSREAMEEKIFSDFKALAAQIQRYPDCDKSYQCLYEVIDSNRAANKQLAMGADKLYKALRSTTAFIDSLKDALRLIDATLESTDAPKFILTGNTPNKLRKRIASFSALCYSNAIDTSCRHELDDVFRLRKAYTLNDAKIESVFEMLPTAAALAMLTVFRNDCNDGTTVTLKNMKQHLVRNGKTGTPK